MVDAKILEISSLFAIELKLNSSFIKLYLFDNFPDRFDKQVE